MADEIDLSETEVPDDAGGDEIGGSLDEFDAGRYPVAAAAPAPKGEVRDLMEALRASIEAAKTAHADGESAA